MTRFIQLLDECTAELYGSRYFSHQHDHEAVASHPLHTHTRDHMHRHRHKNSDTHTLLHWTGTPNHHIAVERGSQ